MIVGRGVESLVMASLAAAFGTALAGTPAADPQQASEPCRPCHATRRGGVFDQWLESPYSDRDAGVGCRGCHTDERLPAGCRVAPAAVAPSPSAHRRPAVDVLVAAVCRDGLVSAEVLVCNTGAGHALPTGDTGSVLVLTVEVRDAAGVPRTCIAGPRLPSAVGGTAEGAGTVYHGGDALAAFATQVTELVFAGPCGSDLTMMARLLRQRQDSEAAKTRAVDDVVAVASRRVVDKEKDGGGR